MGDASQPWEMAGLVESVVGSYERHCGSVCPFPRFLPSKDVVIEIVETLRRILFPGYFGEAGVEAGDVRYHVASLLIEVRDKLRQQVCRAFANDAADERARRCGARECGIAACGECGRDIVEEGADTIVGEFLAKLPGLREILLTDVDATFDGDPAARGAHEIIFAYPGIFAITAFRLAHELFLLRVPLIPRIMTEYAHSLTGIDIHPGATVGRHFFIDHGTGIVIGETTTIGNHVKIYQGVTLGALSTRGGQSLRGVKRHPTLEDEVTVYSSATILGGESVIGRGAVVGANAFITRSVPAGARVSIKLPELAIKV
jgi:serine O-acetyltransferase